MSTAKEAAPPTASDVALVGAIATISQGAACSIVKTRPSTVMVPVRAAPRFSSTV